MRARFKDHTRIDDVVAHMRCHQAYARARAFEDVMSCPLYVRGVEFRRGDDPLSVEIVSADKKTTTLIRARSREEAVFVRQE